MRPLSPRWDIPKGIAEAGETFAAAARRELYEETGLLYPRPRCARLAFSPICRGKDLALFVWVPPRLPDPEALVCPSCF